MNDNELIKILLFYTQFLFPFAEMSSIAQNISFQEHQAINKNKNFMTSAVSGDVLVRVEHLFYYVQNTNTLYNMW